MYESGVTCSGRTPRSSTLSILSPPPSPLIAHGVHARTPTTKSKPATVRRGTGHVPTTPFRASMCVYMCACATTSIPPFDFSFLGKTRNWLENSNPRPFEMCILDSKVEMEEIGEGQRTMRGKEEEEDSRGWWFFEIPISCYERCLELLLLAAPYVALLRTPHTGSSSGRTRNGRRMRVENRCYVTNRN